MLNLPLAGLNSLRRGGGVGLRLPVALGHATGSRGPFPSSPRRECGQVRTAISARAFDRTWLGQWPSTSSPPGPIAARAPSKRSPYPAHPNLQASESPSQHERISPRQPNLSIHRRHSARPRCPFRSLDDSSARSQGPGIIRHFHVTLPSSQTPRQAPIQRSKTPVRPTSINAADQRPDHPVHRGPSYLVPPTPRSRSARPHLRTRSCDTLAPRRPARASETHALHC